MRTMAELVEAIGDIRLDPSAGQRIVLKVMEDALNSDEPYELVDPSNPLVMLWESSVATGIAGIQRTETLMRRVYPQLAQSEEDLYGHMIDSDYLDRFAAPSEAVFTLLLSVDEIRERAILGTDGVRRMRIPADTQITVEDMSFTFQYPIEIRVMNHGGLQVMYDISKPSPISVLSSNVVDWQLVTIRGDSDVSDAEMLMMQIPLKQFEVTSHFDQLNPSTGFNKRYGFDDRFYHARVYVANDAGNEWVEIHTTHSEQVYDGTRPTALLTVIDDELSVRIPQIYFTTDQLSRGVRVDIYTTQGELNQPLERLSPNSYEADWLDRSMVDSPLNTPIRAFNVITLFSTDIVRGGHNGISFEQLRDRVINNALGPVDLPITDSQLASKLSRVGYNIVKIIDNTPNRIYIATRSLPRPSIGSLNTAIGVTISTFRTSLEKLSFSRWGFDSNQRVSLRSNALFELNNGQLSLVTDERYDMINNASPDAKVQLLMENRFVYTPFDYVLDSTNDRFDIRAYYFDEPIIRSKRFIAENQTTRLDISTMRYGIERTEQGFKIALITRTGEIAKGLPDGRVHAQLSFIPENEVDRAYLNGEMIGRTDFDEYIFEFNIDTLFDVDRNNNLQLTSFRMYSDADLVTGLPMMKSLDLVYIVSDYEVSGMQGSALDNIQGRWMLPDNSVSVIHEQLDLRFGQALTSLWSRSRSVPSERDYARYEYDVPATYKRVVYERDEFGAIILTRDENDNVQFKILHNAGDPVIIDGQPVMEFNAGEVKLDENDQPIILNQRVVERQVDLFLMDAAFRFATVPSVTQYARETIREVVRWVTRDIGSISDDLLENTLLWYHPRVTLGQVRVTVEDGMTMDMDSDQSFRVKFFMSKLAYENVALRQVLSDMTRRVISAELEKDVVSISNMKEEIKSRAGTDVLDVVVSGLGGSNNYAMLSLDNPSDQINVRKQLLVLPDNTITVQDDVAIEFSRHRN